MTQILDNIEKLCNEVSNNVGIKTFIDIVEECGVEAIPAPVALDATDETTIADTAHSINGDITLKVGYDFKTWYYRKKDSTFNCVDEGEEDASSKVSTLSFYIPRVGPFTTYILNSCSGKYVIAKLQDNNNTKPMLLGEVGNGMYCKVTLQTDPKSGYLVELKGEHPTFPYYYGGAV